MSFYETIFGKLCYPGSTFQARGPLGLDQKPRKNGECRQVQNKLTFGPEEGQTHWHQGSGKTGSGTGNQIWNCQERADKTKSKARH